MGRKIRAINSTTGNSVEIDEGKVKSGRIRNRSLPDPLLTRVRAVHTKIKHVYDVTLEQFEIPFMRDSDPEGEVGTWEAIASGFEKVALEMPEADQKMVLRTLLTYSLDSLTQEEEADPVLKKIIEIVERE